MRLAVSNIAWDRAEDEHVASVLQSEGVGGIEIAPTKWRADALLASAVDVAAYRREWNDRGLRIVSLQSLLFGRPDLQLFGSDAVRSAMLDHLRQTIDLAAALGAHALVFGSPGNRKRGDLTAADANAIAATFLRELGAHAESCGATVCIEANPPEYGCDFVTTTAEAIALSRAVDHPGVGVNGDLGGITLSKDDPATAIEAAGTRLAHVHASEPHLAELGAAADHRRAAEALARVRYPGWVSVEMRAAADGKNVDAVRRAVRVAKSMYGAAVSR